MSKFTSLLTLVNVITLASLVRFLATPDWSTALVVCFCLVALWFQSTDKSQVAGNDDRLAALERDLKALRSALALKQ